MSDAPKFASAAKIGFASVSVANANRDGTGTIVDALTGVAAGTRVERVVLKSTGNLADSIVTMFLHDGTAYRLYDEFDVSDPAAGDTTTQAYRTERQFSDLILPSASWKIAFAITVAPTSGVCLAFVHGADLT